MTQSYHRSKLTRVLTWPAQRPMLMLLISAVCAVVAGVAVIRIKPSSSLESMFAKDNRAATVMFQQLHDFALAEDLLLMVSLPDDAAQQSRKPATDRGVLPRVDPQRFFDFAQRLEVAIAADRQASTMVSAVVWQAGAQIQQLIDQVMFPNMLFYLDDDTFEDFQLRLSAEAMTEQIQRNEALMAAPSIAAEVLAKQILQDPLRLYELLTPSLGAIDPSGGAQNKSGALLSPDGRSLLIRISAVAPAGDMQFTKQFMVNMRQIVAQADPAGLEVAYGGGYAIAEISEQKTRSDMIRTVVISVILLQLLFLIVYRQWWSFLLAFIPVAAGILCGLALFTFISTDITPITAVVGGILAGLGIDYCIHYLSHYELRRAQGATAQQAANMSHKLVFAMFGACGTSIIAFGVVWGSNAQALRHFSMLGVLSLACAFISSLTLLPAFLMLTDRQPAREYSAMKLRMNMAPLMTWIKNHARLCMRLTITVFVICVVLLMIKPKPMVQFETDMRVMHPQNNPPLDTQDKITKQFTRGTQTVSIHLQATSPKELLQLAHQVDKRLRTDAMKQAGVQQSFGLASLLPDPQEIPQRRALIEKINVERVIADFRTVMDRSVFNVDAYSNYIESLKTLLRPSAALNLATLLNYPSLTQICLPKDAFVANSSPPTQAITLVHLQKIAMDHTHRGRTIDTLRTALSDLSNATLTGMDILSYDLQRATRRDLLTLPAIAGIVVMMWLLMMFRNIGDVALAILPTLFSMTCLFVAMWAMQINLNLINAVALPLLAGIGVDDGIFLVSSARRRRDDSRGSDDLSFDDLTASGHAITMTSLTTVLGFGSLLFTHTPAIQSLGLVLAVGIAGCWIGSFFCLLPILVLRSHSHDTFR